MEVGLGGCRHYTHTQVDRALTVLHSNNGKKLVKNGAKA